MNPIRNLVTAVALMVAPQLPGQVLLSAGTYSQSFDSPALANASSQGTNWLNNMTLPGWYAETGFGAITNYRVGSGGVNNGALYSFGVAGVNPITDRGLGSVGSGSYPNLAYGLRIQNDTLDTIGAFVISYTGEQWRNGAPTTPAVQSLAFSYRIDSMAITSPDWANTGTPAWTAVPDLSFDSPVLGGTAGSLDGNDAANRTALSATLFLSLAPGQEIFFRWFDLNDLSNDHGLAVDDVTISYAIPEPGVFSLLAAGSLGPALWQRRALRK